MQNENDGLPRGFEPLSPVEQETSAHRVRAEAPAGDGLWMKIFAVVVLALLVGVGVSMLFGAVATGLLVLGLDLGLKLACVLLLAGIYAKVGRR